MNDYENDGRDYGEIIDEGPTNVETEGFFSSKPDPNKQEQKKKESSALPSSGKCTCKPASEPRQGRRKKKMKKEKEPKGSTGGGGGGKRGRRRKEKRLTNPFIIFYLEMYSKNRTLCVAEVAREAGRIWKNMSAKEKETYINRARRSQSARTLAKSKKKGKKSEE